MTEWFFDKSLWNVFMKYVYIYMVQGALWYKNGVAALSTIAMTAYLRYPLNQTEILQRKRRIQGHTCIIQQQQDLWLSSL